MISRWIELIAPFNYTITYRAGSENKAADALSRIALYDHSPKDQPNDPKNSLKIERQISS